MHHQIFRNALKVWSDQQGELIFRFEDRGVKYVLQKSCNHSFYLLLVGYQSCVDMTSLMLSPRGQYRKANTH